MTSNAGASTSITLVPNVPVFPVLAPSVPQPYPKPLPRRSGVRPRLLERRDLVQEATDLSEEEQELEDLYHVTKNRGYQFLVPVGKHTTLAEEKADNQVSSGSSSGSGSEDDSGSGSGSEDEDGAVVSDDDDENDGEGDEVDLDADLDIPDLDAEVDDGVEADVEERTFVNDDPNMSL